MQLAPTTVSRAACLARIAFDPMRLVIKNIALALIAALGRHFPPSSSVRSRSRRLP